VIRRSQIARRDRVQETAAKLAAYEAGAKLRHAAVSERRGHRASTIALMGAVDAVLESYAVPVSTRQVYYQLISRGVVANAERSYEQVQRLIVTMRRAGDIAHDKIVDRGRTKHQRPGWDGAADVMAELHSQYRRDVWSAAETVVMIGLEKAALEGVIAEAADAYGASVWTLRGFASESFGYEWSEEIKRHTENGQRVVVAFFGDFDPSGLAIEADAKEKLGRHGAVVEWARHGLLWSDFDEHRLVNVGVKDGDSRTARYRQTFGACAAELDALDPTELHRRVTRVLEQHVDRDALARLRRAESAEKASLALVANNWTAALAGARAANEVRQ